MYERRKDKGDQRTATEPRGNMAEKAEKKEQILQPSKSPHKEKNTCPLWSVKGTLQNDSVTLTNTCTIDNLLYIIHLILSRYTQVVVQIESSFGEDLWLWSLLEVHQHFLRREWTQGRIAWLMNFHQFKEKIVWDWARKPLSGFAAQHIAARQRHHQVSRTGLWIQPYP